MSDIVIKAENISKLYQLGQIGTGMISNDLKRWWALMRGKEDPFLKVGMVNDRTQKATSDYTWAVKDVNFELPQGEAIGIIGKNGAGKSTLLKIISRVTAPTTGSIKIKGRMASLLEVGTGFVPELTGRENIYMNGTILGMTRKEITRKFDEIVDFAGVEMYIDTPVKRYSSGMYVRLAFGVAAHLEPEILIIDEVLAVGDAEFQKKCLGKMSDVTSQGRTIIFVSHNLLAVQSLCKSAIFMKSGTIVDRGPSDKVIANYLSREIRNCVEKTWDMNDAPGNDRIRLLAARVNVPRNGNGEEVLDVNTPFDIEFEFHNNIDGQVLNLSLMLYTTSGTLVFNSASIITPLSKGRHTSRLRIPGQLLNDDIYTISLHLVRDASTILHTVEDVLTFEVVDVKRSDVAWFGKWPGAVRPSNLEFSID